MWLETFSLCVVIWCVCELCKKLKLTNRRREPRHNEANDDVEGKKKPAATFTSGVNPFLIGNIEVSGTLIISWDSDN